MTMFRRPGEFVHHLEPVHGPIGLVEPQPQHLLVPSEVPAQALITDFHPQRIGEHHQIAPVRERVLLFPYLPERRVGSPAHRFRRCPPMLL